MREQHLDFLSVLARLLVSIGLCNVARDIPRRFMNAASDLSSRSVRAATRLHGARRDQEYGDKTALKAIALLLTRVGPVLNAVSTTCRGRSRDDQRAAATWNRPAELLTV
jgi:hypothetical protein